MSEFSASPVQALGEEGVGFLTSVVALSSSNWHTLAVDGAGAVWAWGYNIGAAPVKVSGLPPIAAVSAGGYHSLALDRNGGVWISGQFSR